MPRGAPMGMYPPPHPAHVTFWGIPEEKVASLISTVDGR